MLPVISPSMSLPPSRNTLQPPLTSGEVTGRAVADEGAPSAGQDIGRCHPPSTRRHGLYYSGPFCRQVRKLGLSEAKLSAQSHMAHVLEPESKPQAICLQSPCSSHCADKERTDKKLMLPSHPTPTSGEREKPLFWQME